MKILIIGSEGFVGHYLKEKLDTLSIAYDCFDIKLHGNFYGDIRRAEDFNSLPTDYNLIINLAAVHKDNIDSRAEYIDTNVHGSENICNFAAKHSINKVIFLSSVAIYGFSDKLIDENAPHNFFNYYGESKHLAEQVYQDWQLKSPARKIVIIRPTVIFGEGNRGNVFNLINQIAKFGPLVIGDGENIKSICYVRNVVDFIIHASQHTQEIIISNYVDLPNHSMNKFTSTVSKAIFLKHRQVRKIPYLFAYSIGKFFDYLRALCKIKSSISSVRVQKFKESTVFASSSDVFSSFAPAFTLDNAIERTVQHDFHKPDPNRKIFQV
jgi:GlcNAc-P-P-Und epimerase